ncbi:cytochrome c, partial [Thioclava sp. BHET1]
MRNSFLFSLFILAGTGIATVALADSQPDAAMQKLVTQGAYVATLGDCAACHTAPGGKPFAGGLPIKSNVGTIYSTNITPDVATGIGNYTEAQFDRAVRQGVRADGAHLYPAMPYPSYSKISDADMHALYAYFKHGVAPVSARPQKTKLSFPYNQRWGMSLWNMAFGASPGFKPIPGAS